MDVNDVIAIIESDISDFFCGLGFDSVEVRLDWSSDSKYGDVSTSVALKYAKSVGEDPNILAEKISTYLLDKKNKNIQKADAIKPGFVNIYFSQSFYEGVVLDILKKKLDFGKNNSLKNQKWVVEHTSPNPNKAMHLGHLRNNLVGMGLVRILLWSEAEVVSDAVDNNRGIAIAKLMWGFLAHMRKNSDTPISVDYWELHPELWYSPEECSLLPDIFITRCYVLGESDFKSDADVEAKIRELVVNWEANDQKTWKLWAHVLAFAYEGIQRTLTRLGNHWDKVWHEHEHYQEGKKYIKEGIKKGVFNKLEDGAILTNLANYNLPDTILLKRDGTSLYITQDIALTALKKKYYKAQKLIWVIGPEQSLAMKQLFAVCEQLGIGTLKDFTHISYGYVGLKDDSGGFKKMSSREGTVILIDDVIDTVREKILERFIVNGKFKDDDLVSISEKIALAALKFSILKSDRDQNLVFDIEQSIETTGDSGVYVLYAYVRIQSILRKGGVRGTIKFPSTLGLESDLLKLLALFPLVIKRSLEDFSVHYVAQYLLDLSSDFNGWYAKETILDGSPYQDYKLAITECIGLVIESGLFILGIDTIDAM